jgi:hypothetical protein
MYLPRWYVERHWLPSIGEKLDKIHYREPPPGTGHAERDPNAEYYEVHHDKVNPHQDPLRHLMEDSPETLVGISAAVLAGTVVYAGKRNIGEAFLAALGVGFVSYIVAKLFKSLMSS